MDASSPYDSIDIDEHLDSHSTTTVRKLIGNSPFKPLADIPPEHLEGEVDRVLEILEGYRISVDGDECSPAEAYRFLTTEIMDSEIEDPRAPWWWNCFCYSLFHPGTEEEQDD